MAGQAVTVSHPSASATAAPRANTSRNTLETLAAWIGAVGARRVLDVPCGEGALLALLRPTVPELTGGDLETPCSPLPQVSYVRIDLQGEWPLADGAYDGVVCADGIEHLENPFHLIREAGRVLTADGRLWISTPNITAIRSRWRFLWSGFHNKFKRPLDERARHPLHHINPIGYPELRYALHTTGFTVERVGANRIKPQSWPYALLWPGAALYTTLAFRHDREAAERRRNAEIRRQLLSLPLFLGETLIVQARKGA